MVKPKKKTKWRSLTLEDEDGGGGSGGSTTTNSITSRRNDWKYTNGGGGSGGGGGGHVNNENGSLHYVNGTKYADRRESRGASKTSSSASRYRQTLSSKSQANSQTEPKRVQFNEDEYTKITTPRQDVLFKKGYLSRPKVQTSNNQTSPELSAETALNGITSPLEGEFPYYPSQPYLSDGNYYGNAVYFMPLHDFYYNSPPNGFETDGTQFMAPYQPFSPPLECNDIASPQPLPSTSCSETSELSEDTTQNDAQQLSTSSTPPIASFTNNVATTTEAVVVVVTTKAAAITTTTTNTSTPSTITTSINVAPQTTKIEEPVNGGEGVTKNSTLQAEPQQEQPPVVETTVQHNGDSNGASSNSNNYEMNQSTLPYYTPVYYVNFDCIPPMPYYPYQAINSYEVPEFYPIEVSPAEEVPTTNNAVGVDDIQRASQKAAAQTTVSPVGDDERNAHTDRGEKVDPIIPPVPPQIHEIAHQSTLNADVQEFKPKIYQKIASSNEPVSNHTSKQLHAKKVSHQGNNNVTSSATATQSLPASHLPTSSNNNNNNNRKSRSTLDKKFIRESTKQIEMQNIDLSKKSSRVDIEDPAGINGGGGGRLGSGGVRSSSTSRIEWVIKGGKRVPVQIMPSSPSPPPPPPRAVSPAPMHSENRQKSPGAHENTSVPVITTTDLQSSSQSMTKKPKQRSKAKKSQKKHFSKANNKFEGFVIEEPTFTKTEKHREQTAHAEIVVDEEDELQEAALIENIPWTDADVFDDNETDEIEEPCEVREKAEIVDSHVEFEEIKLPEKTPVVNHVDSVIVMNGEVAVNGVLEKALDCRFSLEVIEEEEILSENAVTVDDLDHIEAQENNVDATKNENELLPHVEQNNKGETFAVEPMTQDQFDEEVLTPEGLERFENHFEPPVEVDCVRIINEPVENHNTKVHEVLLHDPKVEEVKDKVTSSVKLDAKLLNGRKPDVSGTTSSSISIDVPSSSAPPSPPPEPPTTLNGLSAEQPTHTSVSEPVQVIQKYEITAAVCAWLYNFNKNDLQSLFTIPLKADFVRKIKYCAEITKYFENDELTDLEKYVTEQFYQYQLRSSSPSSSWFTDDDDVDDNDEDDDEDNNENDDNQRHTSTNSAHEGNSTIKKFFGCEIM